MLHENKKINTYKQKKYQLEYFSIYGKNYWHKRYYVGKLYDILLERMDYKNVNINHVEMPTYKNHEKFIVSKPYKVWNIIHVLGVPRKVIGTYYITKNNEIGIFIFKHYQGLGYGDIVMERILELHKRKKLVANININNNISRKFFEKHGFEPKSITYMLPT